MIRIKDTQAPGCPRVAVLEGIIQPAGRWWKQKVVVVISTSLRIPEKGFLREEPGVQE